MRRDKFCSPIPCELFEFLSFFAHTRPVAGFPAHKQAPKLFCLGGETACGRREDVQMPPPPDERKRSVGSTTSSASTKYESHRSKNYYLTTVKPLDEDDRSIVSDDASTRDGEVGSTVFSSSRTISSYARRAHSLLNIRTSSTPGVSSYAHCIEA